MYENLIDNKNAEKWDLETSVKFMQDSLDLAKKKKHDFIGEVARDMDTYRELYVYLKDKYKECESIYKRLVQECESNCFSHGKSGDIVPSLAIMNLKSNHGWTDRIDTTTKGNEVKSEKVTINFTKK